MATAALPGFDLQLVGSPSQQLDVLKFVQDAGLPEEVLAQLFPQNGATSIDLKATSKELAEAVAKTINEWVTAAVEQVHHFRCGGLGELIPQRYNSITGSWKH